MQNPAGVLLEKKKTEKNMMEVSIYTHVVIFYGAILYVDKKNNLKKTVIYVFHQILRSFH